LKFHALALLFRLVQSRFVTQTNLGGQAVPAELPKALLGHTKIVSHKGCSPARVDWDKFRIFVAVARAGSFTRAAHALGIRQPTVSRSIEQLEGTIGAKLFDRGSHGHFLTSEGRDILNDVLAAEMMLSRVVSRVGGKCSSPEGDCKLLMSEGLAAHWFARYFLTPFTLLYPNIQLRLSSDVDITRTQIPPYDIQIQFAPPSDPTMMTTKVGSFHFMFFASKNYLARHPTPKTFEDLHGHKLVEVSTSLTNKSRWTTYSQSASPLPASIFSNTGNIVAEAVLAGAAIGYMPSYAYVTDQRYVPLVRFKEVTCGIYVSFSRDGGERPSVRAMIDYLKDVVFNKSQMPWFRDEFERPNAKWRARFDQLRNSVVRSAGIS
jgi:DNA-binding transcriptional LysR family regulator